MQTKSFARTVMREIGDRSGAVANRKFPRRQTLASFGGHGGPMKISVKRCNLVSQAFLSEVAVQF